MIDTDALLIRQSDARAALITARENNAGPFTIAALIKAANQADEAVVKAHMDGWL